MTAQHPSEALEIVSLLKCPACERGMLELQTRAGVMSRLHACPVHKLVWFTFGDRLFRCANADALLVPGQL